MKFLTLILEEKALGIMMKDALNAFPNECCGFAFGFETPDQRVVTYASPANNAKDGDKKRRFQISPSDYQKAELYAIDNSLTLLGIYHSHPLHSAIASEHDLAVAMPWFSYIILSVNDDGVTDIKSWQLNSERQFEEETVVLQSILKI